MPLLLNKSSRGPSASFMNNGALHVRLEHCSEVPYLAIRDSASGRRTIPNKSYTHRLASAHTFSKAGYIANHVACRGKELRLNTHKHTHTNTNKLKDRTK